MVRYSLTSGRSRELWKPLGGGLARSKYHLPNQPGIYPVLVGRIGRKHSGRMNRAADALEPSVRHLPEEQREEVDSALSEFLGLVAIGYNAIARLSNQIV